MSVARFRVTGPTIFWNSENSLQHKLPFLHWNVKNSQKNQMPCQQQLWHQHQYWHPDQNKTWEALQSWGWVTGLITSLESGITGHPSSGCRHYPKPWKRAFVLVFWVPTILWLPPIPQPWKRAFMFILGVPTFLWPPPPPPNCSLAATTMSPTLKTSMNAHFQGWGRVFFFWYSEEGFPPRPVSIFLFNVMRRMCHHLVAPSLQRRVTGFSCCIFFQCGENAPSSYSIRQGDTLSVVLYQTYNWRGDLHCLPLQ